MAATAAAATDLVAYVNKLLNGAVDFSQEIKKGEFATIIKAVLPKTEKLLSHSAETDVEGCFTLLTDVIRGQAKDVATADTKTLLATLTTKVDDKALLRLRITTNVFNKLKGFPELRFESLVQIITFASKSNHVELVSSYFDNVESLVDTKALTPAQRRTLYLTIADVIAQSEPKSVKELLFLDKFLSSFVDPAKYAQGKDVAVRATKIVLLHPVASFASRVDLVANSVVATLKSCSTNGKLYELLSIVSTKTLAEFIVFQKAAGAAFFKDAGLDETDLISTMRLFTLCAQPTGFDEISYATIAKALAVPEDDVEQWVVKAITQNLVSAKIDQLRRTVVISRVLQRGFSAAQWQEINVKLQLYKKNVGALLDVVRSARQQQK